MSVVLSESDIVARLAERVCQRLARSVIAHLQSMDDALLSGKNSGLKNTWEEICVQLQLEVSFSWEAYDETVRGLADGLVAALPLLAKQAVWQQTPEGIEWCCEASDDRTSYPVGDDDITDYLLRNYVYAAAANWSNKRIRSYLERSYVAD